MFDGLEGGSSQLHMRKAFHQAPTYGRCDTPGDLWSTCDVCTSSAVFRDSLGHVRMRAQMKGFVAVLPWSIAEGPDRPHKGVAGV